MKNILNNKILPIMLLAVIFIFSIMSNVFASERVSFPSNTEELINEWIESHSYSTWNITDYCIVKDYKDDIFLCLGHIITDTSTGLGLPNSDGKRGNIIAINVFGGLSHSIYQLVDGSWVTCDYPNPGCSENSYLRSEILLDFDETKTYTDDDFTNYADQIYCNSTPIGSISVQVFQPAPQVPGITQALVEQAKEANPLVEIKGLVLIVLAVIVTIIALYKGLHLLYQALVKA